MTTHYLSRTARDIAVEQTLDAAIEINEVMQGKRSHSPALTELVSNLMGLRGADLHTTKNNLLSDSQFTSLYHRAARSSGRDYASASELNDVLDLLLKTDTVGLSRFEEGQLLFIRDFCLGLNRELVAEAFNRTPEPPLAHSRNQNLATADGD